MCYMTAKRGLSFEIPPVTGENPAVHLKSYCRVLTLVLSLCISVLVLNLRAQGTAFMYQGQLDTNGIPVTGLYDFTFTLYSAATSGSVISTPQTNFGVPVVNGLFTTNLDFGPVFNGS